MARVAARGWKGEVNLRSVLGLAWVERGGYVRGWRKESLGSLRPMSLRWKAGQFVGQQEQWWAVWELVGFARGRMELPDWQRLKIRLPLLRFYADGLMKARLAVG